MCLVVLRVIATLTSEGKIVRRRFAAEVFRDDVIL